MKRVGWMCFFILNSSFELRTSSRGCATARLRNPQPRNPETSARRQRTHRLRNFRVTLPKLFLRMCQEVALQQIDPELPARLILFGRLDALGDGLRVDFSSELDEHAHEILFDRLPRERRHEALCDLEIVRRQRGNRFE